MAMVRFKLPDVGEGVAEAEIVAWRVAVGDVVEEDQGLVDVMTDKATVELPAPVGGRITRLEGEPGDLVPVGTVIVEIDAAASAEEGAPNGAAADAPLAAEAAAPVAQTGQG
ncbi:MAG: 2-oxo acid dehydrogenase subunit E2, partial [Caulobacterales bacterium]|nr:2-oxo acid dehydrogenase subunit E2 [Caulobacterales bacterium]